MQCKRYAYRVATRAFEILPTVVERSEHRVYVSEFYCEDYQNSDFGYTMDKLGWRRIEN